MSQEIPMQRASRRSFRITQESVVTAIAVVLFVTFSALLPNFLTQGNVLTLLKNVAILGTLATGMGFIVVGRGIDLTMVAVMVVGVAFAIWLTTQGFSFGPALAIGALLVVACGLVTGLLVAVAEIPPIFATLAMASVIYGGGRVAFNSDVLYAPAGIACLSFIGSGTILGIPASVAILAALAALIALFLRLTRFGRFIYATDDNPNAARTTAEIWRHRILAVDLATGRSEPALSHLPAYPARIAPAAGTGFWLSFLSIRNQLVEFILREDAYRTRMLAEVPEHCWMAPALSSGQSFREPMQGSQLRRMGVTKPFAETRSYGLVVYCSPQMKPLRSFHSRADGAAHGCVSVCERRDDLFVASKGNGKVLRVPGAAREG